MHLREYLKEDGTSPYRTWFEGLNPQAAAKVAVALVRLESGNVSGLKWFSGIGELRIDWGPGYRVYLAQDDRDWIVLYGGGTKATQSTDIERALTLHRAYKTRKRRLADSSKDRARRDF